MRCAEHRTDGRYDETHPAAAPRAALGRRAARGRRRQPADDRRARGALPRWCPHQREREWIRIAERVRVDVCDAAAEYLDQRDHIGAFGCTDERDAAAIVCSTGDDASGHDPAATHGVAATTDDTRTDTGADEDSLTIA
jgi:hypothetical protein